jgi:chromosome segregation ATPase
VITSTAAEREAIQAAMQRLLDGRPQRSTGALTVLQLAAEAGVKRWILTHKHRDLKDEFEKRRDDANGIPAAFQALHARARDAEAANSKLTAENRRLREQVEVYAQVICELATERERRLPEHNPGGNIRALPPRPGPPAEG